MDVGVSNFIRFLKSFPEALPTTQIIQLMGLLGEIYSHRINAPSAENSITELHFVRGHDNKFSHVATCNKHLPTAEMKQTMALLDAGVVSVPTWPDDSSFGKEP